MTQILPLLLTALVAFTGSVIAQPTNPAGAVDPRQELKQAFLDLKFGMFLHFNMATFHNIQHAKGTEDPRSFAPSHLSISQWADAARSARMNYAVLTVRHVDGFCLWPTKTTSHSVASATCSNDIARDFVDTFRKRGMKVGFYYSILDRHNGPDLELTLKQLTELLTNYGDILILWFDAWDKGYTTYQDYPFYRIVKHVRKLQPNCLILVNDNGKSPGPTDIVCHEHDEGSPPAHNTKATEVCYKLQKAWFWQEGFAQQELLPVTKIVDELLLPLNQNRANLLLNCAPNPEGRLDDNVIARLREVGKRLDEVWGSNRLEKTRVTGTNAFAQPLNKL